jgi:Fur family ferric uptake transcriptional regulator
VRRLSNYTTKQGEAILSYIASLEGDHVTVEQLAKHFDGSGTSIGLTTIYRNLDKLLSSGKIRKFVIDGISGACYQYVGEQFSGGEHFHLKCEICREVYHLQCGAIEEISSHVAEEHAFQINPIKTVFYGICDKCREKAK